jgi:hypothetical protein
MPSSSSSEFYLTHPDGKCAFSCAAPAGFDQSALLELVFKFLAQQSPKRPAISPGMSRIVGHSDLHVLLEMQIQPLRHSSHDSLMVI